MENYLKFDYLFTFIEKLLCMIGLSEIYKSEKTSSLKFQRVQALLFILEALTTVFCISCVFAHFINVIIQKDSSKYIEIVDVFVCAFTSILAAFKVLRIVFKQTKIVELVTLLEKSWPDIDRSKDVKKTLTSTIKPIITFFKFYTGVTVVVTLLYGARPLVLMLYEKVTFGSTDFKLPFPLVFLYTWNGSLLNYLITLGILSMSCLYTCIGMIAMDLLLVTLLVNTILQFRLLRNRINNLIHETKYYGQNKELNSRRLKNCIKTHIDILRLIKYQQEIYSPIFFLNFILSSIIICGMTFVLSTSSLYDMPKVCCFLSSTLLETFVICWLGEEIRQQIAILCDAVYSIDWFLCDREFRIMVNIVQICSQRQPGLNAMEFAPVSLITFGDILRTSWSYLTMLKSMSE